MKQPKKLTRQQKEACSAHHLNAEHWLLVEETEFYLKLINKETGSRKTIDKFTKTNKGRKRNEQRKGNSTGLRRNAGNENQSVILNDGKVVRFEENPKPKKVLWFSRHKMTEPQLAALGNIEIVQIDRSIESASELQEEINDCDIIAIVAPIGLQAQFLKVAGDKPVIVALNNRVLVPQEDGAEAKAVFNFVKWERLVKIDVVKEDFKN